MTHLCVYVLECQWLYKIGKTSDLQWRMRSLQAGNPFEIRLVHVIFTEHHGVVEGALHRIFAAHRVRGEWFSLMPKELEQIRSMSVEEILEVAARTIQVVSQPRRIIEIAAQQFLTIPHPARAIVPIKVLEEAYLPHKPRRTLLTSFTRIFSLAWESSYESTPPLIEEELMGFLKLSRRQYFAQKTEMEQLGWLCSSHPADGLIQFDFDYGLEIVEE